MTRETYDILNNIFNGQTPLKRTNPKAGESEYYYFVPGQDDWTSLSEVKTVDVPSADTANPYLQSQTNSFGKPSQLAQNNTQTNNGNSTTSNYRLGTLSGLQESNNGQKLWNDGDLDKTGGWSYGTYQIETKQGTMNDYLNYLNQSAPYQPFYNSLQQAGGYNAALKGDNNFKNAWQELSQNPSFLQSQHNFIMDKKLKPALNYVSDIQGLDFNKRSPVIKDVLFSTVDQHGQGGASDVFHRALGYNANDLSDEDIINKIYNERSDVERYFKRSTANVRNNLRTIRFPQERVKALELLKMYRE